MDGFVPKPIDPKQLTAALRQWVAETRRDLQPLDDAIAQRLALLRNGQPPTANDLGSRVTDAFRSAVPDRLTQISDAIAAHRADLVQRQAHDLIGIAANLGAETMIQVGEQLQTAAESGDLTATTTLVDRIRVEYEIISQALTTT